jgi:tight adherence protein B
VILLSALLVAGAVAWLMPSAGDRRLPPALGAEGRRGLMERLGPRMAAARLGMGPASRRVQAAERVRTIQAMSALAAELESGQPPSVALVRARGRPPVWPRAAATAAQGGDVAAALELDAQAHPVLRQVAACWRVGVHGSGLAASISRVAVAARAAEDVRVEMEGQLAGPRATARVLVVLPLVGVAFGFMLGTDPLAWLLGSTPGLICLAGGVGLTVLGLWWTGRIAASVERRL